ncbi:hypothetical protein LB465_03100 [Salegentibacter sp. LM13S]|uniref:hypothetical protein n=1 Tax=Salegentibacter lacus TaxID=2873599 RepID=UPI001CCFF173|nr:hypothetical protein [Salegentibacter lacus]MBZ9629754.1 hypothetical protein [Salegentibacter lacus]
MKNNYKLLLLVLILIYSCNSDDIEEEIITEEPINNKIELKINGQPSPNRIRGLSASVCCSKALNISFDNLVDTENGNYYGGTGMYLELDTNGNLLSLWYQSYGPRKEYYSPFFDPTSKLNVTGFEFIENEILKVNVSGKIFRESYNFFDAPEAVTIDAEIEIKDFHTCNCNSYLSNISNFNDFIFDGLARRQQPNDISYYANTNNGYQLEFLNFNETFKNIPLGVYVFDENSTSHRIDFRKFIGVPRAFQNSIVPEEWLQYETSGSFEIIEKVQIGGELVTKIKFNLIAKENNEVVFEINNAILQTQM